MGKAVILAINAKYVHSSLSAWMLAAGVSRYARLPHEVVVVESTINQKSNDIVEQVAAHMPDVVGISTYIWNAGKLPDILRLLRNRLPQAVFVLGGPEASHNAEYWLDLDYGADFVLCGEGEQSFSEFLDVYAEGTSPKDIAGICCKESGVMYIKPEAIPSAEPADPYSADFFDALGGRIAYIETSRGCPFSCAFCLSGESTVRFFSLDTAKKQILKLSQSGTQTIKFVDRTFNCNAKRAYELFEYIIGLTTQCCFHFEVAADLFDEATLALLKTAPAGRIQLEAGLQSFFEPALEASSRQTNLARVEQNIRAILDGRNIHVHLDLIAGLPHERLSDFMDGFDRAYAIGAHTLQLGFLKLLHGSKLRAQETGIIFADEPPYEIISSPWMSAEDLNVLKQTENALQHTYNKGRFLLVLLYVLSVSGMRPFEFYRMLGEVVPNHGMPLEDYAKQIYAVCEKLAGVKADKLRDCMVCDWMRMTKGANMPDFLRISDRRRRRVAEKAEAILGRKLRRDESAVLTNGKGVFVDSESRDAVTGLYELQFVEIGAKIYYLQ